MRSFTIILIFALFAIAFAGVVEYQEDGKTVFHGEGEIKTGDLAPFSVPLAASCTAGNCLNLCLTLLNPPLQAWCTGCCTCNCQKL